MPMPIPPHPLGPHEAQQRRRENGEKAKPTRIIHRKIVRHTVVRTSVDMGENKYKAKKPQNPEEDGATGETPAPLVMGEIPLSNLKLSESLRNDERVVVEEIEETEEIYEEEDSYDEGCDDSDLDRNEDWLPPPPAVDLRESHDPSARDRCLQWVERHDSASWKQYRADRTEEEWRNLCFYACESLATASVPNFVQALMVAQSLHFPHSRIQ